MQKPYVVRGRVSDARHIELEEPIEDVGQEVHVLVLPPRPETKENAAKENIFDFIRRLKPGTRTKEDIDRQIQEERDQWDK